MTNYKKKNGQPEDPVGETRGLLLRKEGASLETVSTEAGEFRLLVAGPDVEIVEGRLFAGKRVGLVPFDDQSIDASETYYVLDGTLQAELDSGPLTVREGEVLTTRSLKEFTVLEAQSEVRFLHVTTRPSFHRISNKVHDLMRMAVDVEVRDGYTGGHCHRVQEFSYTTGKVLGLNHSRLHNLAYGAYLHDLGKAKVPMTILQKSGPLTDDEWLIVKRHPSLGREILEQSFMSKAGVIVEQHHERTDGSGYPQGLTGTQIMKEASIVAVADTYDAITTNRPYRPAASPEKAFEELRRFSDVYYPGEVVDAFIEARRKNTSEG